ncbi:MurR/RpiR family transcriptional regulator [Streptomyces oryzae]|uniref:MurR/RpiR family transcriptional regulator n=1 Tax=Streptomyces oryzae TaxID=1434886 RepID=A0ABS3XKX6_9ACTN|nr:MurR/RpiR family transcriptional regulator [Streptomyces oryzae]MBO8196063.1 MurR/RpiR family transcriptional regulator [Streptomyces oryzae]
MSNNLKENFAFRPGRSPAGRGAQPPAPRSAGEPRGAGRGTGNSGPSTAHSTNPSAATASRPGPTALAAKVRTMAPSMTRSMQRVAEAVANDPAGCAQLTVTGLAERTGTSEATVVRTSRLLGYPGYRDLRLALAGLAAQQESGAAPAVTADIVVDDPIADVVAKLAADEQQTLADTAAALDVGQVEAAVAAMATARRIDVYGVGASGLVSQDLAQKLLRIGMVAHSHVDPHLAVTNAVQMRAGDVALAITHSGRTVDVIEPLRVAFDRGATTIAITGRPDGEVAQYADHVLTTSTARESELRPAAMSSRTSQLLVVDCLFIGVAQRTYETAAPALSASYEALAHRHSPRPRNR